MAEIGRPTAMTEEVIRKLEDGFLKGFTDREACLFAGIAPSTLYKYCEENPDFSERKELLKEQIKMRAKDNIATAINTGDKTLSQWYVERRDPDFNPKQQIDHTTKGEKIVQTDEIVEKLTDHLNDLYKGTGFGGDGTLAGSVDAEASDKE